MYRNVLMTGAIAALTLNAGTSSAAMIDIGVYELFNHPAGSQNPPAYGFRLDELYDATGSHDVFTFDFDHPDSEMFLSYTGSTVRIFGSAFGGVDEGTEYADDIYRGVYEIDFTYRMNVGLAAGDDDVEVSAEDPMNNGSIVTPLGDTIGLWDHQGNHDFSFRLGDEDDNLGHRGAPGISGWGWVNHGTPAEHIRASDWIFQMASTPVPAPGSLALLGAGVAIFVRSRR